MKKVRVSILGALCLTCALAGATLATNVASADMPANVSTFEIMEVASVRTGAPEGVRFLARIKTTEKNALENATFGAIVYPTEYITGEFTKDEATDVLDIVAEKWIAADLYEEYGLDSEYSYFTAVVAGKEDTFPASFYQTSLTARGYVQIGENAPIYTESVVERSMAYVAGMALANGEADVNGVLSKVSTGVSVKVGAAAYTLNKGETQKITFTYGGIELKQSDLVKIEYEVDNDDVVSVSADGTITALAGGTAGITATVTIGNSVSTFDLGAKVIVPVDINANLVNAEYVGNDIFNVVGMDVAYTNGEYVLTSTSSVQTDFNQNKTYFEITKETVAKAIAEGYTKLYIHVTTTNRLITQSGADWKETRGKGTISMALSKDLTQYPNGIRFSFDSEGAAGQSLNATIKTLRFMGKPVDLDKDIVSFGALAYMEVQSLSVAYEENVTVNGKQTNAFHVTSSANTAPDVDLSIFFRINSSLIAEAIEAGYTKITVTVYTANSFDIYKKVAWENALTWKRNSTGEAREVTYSCELSKLAEGGMVYFPMGSCLADMYFTSIKFSEKAVDYSKNIVSADLLSSFTCTKTSATYVENAVINSNVTANAIHITSTENVTSSDPGNHVDGAAIFYFNIGADLFKKAQEQGYTKIVIEVYTSNHIDTCKSHWVTEMNGWYRDNTLDTARTITRDVDTYTGYGLYMMLAYIGAPAPANVYITSISFTK